jgi:hypothetical protein
MIYSPEYLQSQKYVLQDRTFHKKARTEKPAIYSKRVEVLDGAVAWEMPLPGYKPEYFVASSVLENDGTKKPGEWADPEDITRVTKALQSYEGEVRIDKETNKRDSILLTDVGKCVTLCI